MTPAEVGELKANLRRRAHRYAEELGWHVFPCAPGGKAPALPRKLGGHGCLDARTDHEIIDAMWDRYPLGNIGVRTGEISGISVLDVGTKGDGFGSLEALIAKHGPLPAGPISETPRGGKHYYFACHPGLRPSAGDLAPGLDIRSEDSFTVVSPSVRHEGSYAWLAPPTTVLAPYPEWLVPPPRQAPPARQVSDGGRPAMPHTPLLPERGNRYAQAVLDRVITDLRASANWPEDYKDLSTGRARGWERFQADCAWELASLALADWNDVTLSQAQQAFLSAAPTGGKWTYWDVEQKWRSQVERARPMDRPRDRDRDRSSNGRDEVAA